MKILTLSEEDVREHCRRLWEQVASDGFKPEAIIAVLSAGAEIGQRVLNISGESIQYLECHPQRKSTKKKKLFLGKFLHRLPRPVLDILRIAESKFNFTQKKRAKISSVTFSADVTNAKRILIIDDAVDSGATLEAVVHVLRENNPNADIRCASITVTSENPVIKPDYCLYKNKTLIRFPWSMDAKK